MQCTEEICHNFVYLVGYSQVYKISKSGDGGGGGGSLRTKCGKGLSK
jgi:hypothetical protein